jgi:hypothetical protein
MSSRFDIAAMASGRRTCTADAKRPGQHPDTEISKMNFE